RRLPIGAAEHNLPVHLLHTPAASSKVVRQPVEQFLMGRLLSLPAEVIARRHQTAAKMLLPKAVDGDARGEWIGGIDEPVGEVEASRRPLSLWERVRVRV